jgi:hypothetical protein
VKIGKSGVSTQVTDGFVTMVHAMLVSIGAFVAVAVTGRALDLSALISMLMLRSIVVTNATVLRDLAVVTNATVLRDFVQREIEASDDVVGPFADEQGLDLGPTTDRPCCVRRSPPSSSATRRGQLANQSAGDQ